MTGSIPKSENSTLFRLLIEPRSMPTDTAGDVDKEARKAEIGTYKKELRVLLTSYVRDNLGKTYAKAAMPEKASDGHRDEEPTLDAGADWPGRTYDVGYASQGSSVGQTTLNPPVGDDFPSNWREVALPKGGAGDPITVFKGTYGSDIFKGPEEGVTVFDLTGEGTDTAASHPENPLSIARFGGPSSSRKYFNDPSDNGVAAFDRNDLDGLVFKSIVTGVGPEQSLTVIVYDREKFLSGDLSEPIAHLYNVEYAVSSNDPRPLNEAITTIGSLVKRDENIGPSNRKLRPALRVSQRPTS